jgi:uncharacterized membrane protein YqgA involved in biofilm formation
MKGMGLCVILIGMRDAFKTNDMMCVIVCIALGAIIGETARIEARLEKLGGTIRERFAAKSSADSTFVEGFVTASLVYCTGAMAIVGSLEGGLNGVHNTLYAKSLLDGVTAVFFASTLGSGVLLSAAPVFLYQGAIAMLARLVAPLLTDDVVREMSAVGGLLIVGIGFNLTEAAKIRVGNLMPATFLPLLYIPIFR